VKGKYSGELVRDDAIAFIEEMARANGTKPLFLYIPFQEAHSPYQVSKEYREMYPELSGKLDGQNLAGMLTHNDRMIGDIFASLTSTGLMQNTILVFSTDNGGPGGQDKDEVPSPSRFDSVVIERNYPFRGQKHEIYEGGVRAPGFIYSPLLPPSTAGSSVDALFHITDWLPTLASAAGVSVTMQEHLPFDGQDLWKCILGDKSRCSRQEVLLNFNTVCDDAGAPSHSFKTECPAPKAGLRLGDLKLLAECYDAASGTLSGKLLLFNVTADPSESTDLLTSAPEAVVRKLKERLIFFGTEASQVAPLSNSAPWQGEDYFCAKCEVGHPGRHNKAWEPWCAGGANVPCPSLEYV